MGVQRILVRWSRWVGPGGPGGPAVLVGAVLVVGVLASGVLATVQVRQEREHRSAVMDQRSAAVRDAVNEQIRRYTDTVWDLAAAAGAQDPLTEAGFAALNARVNAQQLPGAAGVSFVVPASDAQIPEVQRHWRAAGNPGLTLHPVGTQREHLMNVLSTVPGEMTRGRDASAADEPAQALVLARNHQHVQASSTYILLKDRGLPRDRQQLAFVLVNPVYARAGSSPGQFEGWIVMPFHGSDFITDTMRQAAQSTVAVTLLDASTSQAALVQVAHLADRPVLNDPRLRRQVTVTVAGRPWQLIIQPTTGMFASMGPSPALLTGLAGLVITALLAGLVAALSLSRRRALRQVVTATEALRQDIARREQVEAQLRRNESELREHEAELEAFAGVVAHDLKAPLTGVVGYTEVLQDRYRDSMDEMGRRCLDKIIGGAGRMRSLIDDLLAYAAARDMALNYTGVDLTAMVQDIAAERIAERVAGDAEVPAIEFGSLPTLTADPVLIRQLLDNLIGNALKYVRPGDTPYVSVTASSSAVGWLIEVGDHGIGIAEEDRDSVFETFHRVRGSEGYSGTGLGLAICKRIVERHHGHIDVTGNAGGGSTFRFLLPHVVDRTPAPAELTAPVAG